MYYPCSENKGADQIRGYRQADLRLCFRICKNPVFSQRGSYFREYIENIRYVDKGIRQMEELIEGYYGNDGRTAYVMSSDHGMTDWGRSGYELLSDYKNIK